MSESAPTVERDVAGGVCTLTLNRPDAMNAVTTKLASDLRDALAEGARQADVILIRGAGGNFCAGGDFHHLQEVRSDPAALRALFEGFSAACSLIAELPVPVVAVVEGVAMAGGFELMQSCDFALVAEDARIADNHSNHAMVPGGGGTQRLPRLVGSQRALGLILSGDRLSGSDAVEWGLAYRAYPASELYERASELGAALASKDRDALARTKALIRAGEERPLADGLQMEIEAVLEHLGGASAAEGISGFTGAAEHAGRAG
jgi:enoyl-CoA hydratase/carnithine racemase